MYIIDYFYSKNLKRWYNVWVAPEGFMIYDKEKTPKLNMFNGGQYEMYQAITEEGGIRYAWRKKI